MRRLFFLFSQSCGTNGSHETVNGIAVYIRPQIPRSKEHFDISYEF